MKYTLVVILACFYSLRLSAQDSLFFQLRDQSDVPAAIAQSVLLKIDQTKASIKKDSVYSKLSKENDLIHKSNFFIDNLLKGGMIYYDNQLTAYIRKVMANIEGRNPDLYKNTQVYVLRSGEVNAFATQQNQIFVTAGLLSKLENEAQLAFILCHEIVHVREQHILESYVDKQEFVKSQRYRLSKDELITHLSDYSKEHEFEADGEGFQYFEKTFYDPHSAIRTFDILHHSYLPFEEVPFDFSTLETPEVLFPAFWITDTLNAIKTNEDYDDSKSSHPNTDKRKSRLIVGVETADEGMEFILDEDEFHRIQKLARVESIRSFLRERRFAKAYYNSWLMYRKDPAHRETYQKMMGKALYGIAKYKGIERYDDMGLTFDEAEGEISALCYLFDQMDGKSAHVLAIRELNKVYKYDPSPYVESLIIDLLVDVQQLYKQNWQDLYEQADSINNASEDGLARDSLSILKQFSALMFEDLKDDPKFESLCFKSDEEYKQVTAFERKWTNPYKVGRFNYRKWEKHKSVAINQVGLSKALTVSPFFMEVSEKKGLLVPKSETMKIKTRSSLEDLGDQNQIDLQLLSFNERSASNYFDHSQINLLISEFYNHTDDIQDFILSEAEYSYYLANKYDTQNVLFSGLGAIRFKKTGALYVILLTAYILPALPLVGIWLFSPDYMTLSMSQVLDLTSGRHIASYSEYFRTPPDIFTIKNMLYRHLNIYSLPPANPYSK